MVLRHVSILRDHPQGVCLYLAKVTELFKRFEEFFKFKTLNLKSRLLNPALWQQYWSGCVLWPLWCHALDCIRLESHKVHVLVFYPLLNWKMHGETMKNVWIKIKFLHFFGRNTKGVIENGMYARGHSNPELKK